MTNSIEYSYFLGRQWDFIEFCTIAQEAERLGFSAIFHEDNLLNHDPAYPRYTPGFDVWTLMTALACVTKTIRIGSMATPAPRRFAPLLAKTVASLDVISNGRTIVGLGAGDDKEQFDMIGQTFPAEAKDRRALVRETLEVLRKCWTEDRANYNGRFYTLRNAVTTPKCIQKPSPPIWLCVNTSKKLMPFMAAELADALMVMWGNDETVATVLDNFKTCWAELGRDPSKMIAARFVFPIICDEEEVRDWRSEFAQWTGHTINYDEHHSTTTVPEDSDSCCFIVGTPAKIIADIRERVLELGFNHICIMGFSLGRFAKQIDCGSLGRVAGNYLGSMRYIAEQIIPELTEVSS